MRLLDLFCGAGGAAVGYSRAGFSEIVGVDVKKQPNYPFEFYQDDALIFLKENINKFDAIHASPPCQAYSKFVKSDGRWSHGVHKGFNEPRLIEPLRELLTDKVYVIENVMGAKDYLHNPIKLCGAMFGLSIQRHRLFESSVVLEVPDHPKCTNLKHPYAEKWLQEKQITDRRVYSVVGKCRQSGCYEVWRQLMEMPWAKYDHEMAEAIPPAYTQYIGSQILS